MIKINGMDVEKGLLRYEGDKAAYLKVLHSFAFSVRTMLNEIEVFDPEQLRFYTIKVHGIKGAGYDIYADQLGREAEALEIAGKQEDVDFIVKQHKGFMEQAWQLVNDIDSALAEMAAENPKPSKDKPDIETLLKLKEACADYDIDGVDEAMDELESYRYESDFGTVEWLRTMVDMMRFTQIVERLSIYE